MTRSYHSTISLVRVGHSVDPDRVPPDEQEVPQLARTVVLPPFVPLRQLERLSHGASIAPGRDRGTPTLRPIRASLGNPRQRTGRTTSMPRLDTRCAKSSSKRST